MSYLCRRCKNYIQPTWWVRRAQISIRKKTRIERMELHRCNRTRGQSHSCVFYIYVIRNGIIYGKISRTIVTVVIFITEERYSFMWNYIRQRLILVFSTYVCSKKRRVPLNGIKILDVCGQSVFIPSIRYRQDIFIVILITNSFFIPLHKQK